MRTSDTIEELRVALVEFATRYNETWLVARHGYRTPAQVRADQCRLDQNATGRGTQSGFARGCCIREECLYRQLSKERTMTFDLPKARKLAETAVILKKEFLKTANWRREQAIDYPDDKWNFEAVVLLEQLANTVDEIDPRLLEAYVGFWERDGLPGKTQTEMLRGVAFNWAPQTASEFVSEFNSKMASGT